MFKKQKTKVNIVEKRWIGTLQPNFKLKSTNTWHKQSQKKAKFI